MAKHDLRVAAYGTVDEANAVIGLARLHADAAADAMLARIQNDLFDLGADLCRPGDDPDEKDALRIQARQVHRLEAEIDELNAALQPARVLRPAGRPAGRGVSSIRRAPWSAGPSAWPPSSPPEPVNPVAIRYLNRLSDHLFVLARHLNDRGAADVLWVPGAHRRT